MVALGVLFLFIAVALFILGYVLLRKIAADWLFLKRGRGVTATGICINHRWTTRGWVSSGVEFRTVTGDRQVAWTGAQPTIPVQVGDKAIVLYDPSGKATPMVDGDQLEKSLLVFCCIPFAVGTIFLVIALFNLF